MPFNTGCRPFDFFTAVAVKKPETAEHSFDLPVGLTAVKWPKHISDLIFFLFKQDRPAYNSFQTFVSGKDADEIFLSDEDKINPFPRIAIGI